MVVEINQIFKAVNFYLSYLVVFLRVSLLLSTFLDWGNSWDVVEVHHVGPEDLHFLEVLSYESWSWVHLHGVGKLNNVSLLEPVLRVEVLLGEAWSLRPLEAFEGCVQRCECVHFIGGGLEEKASVSVGPHPSEEPV